MGLTRQQRIKHHEQDRLDEIDSVQIIVANSYGDSPKARQVATDIIDLLHPPRWRTP